MSSRTVAFSARGLLLSSLLVGCVSCTQNEVVTHIQEDHARLQSIATIYAYACRDLGRPPKNTDELKPTFAKAGLEDVREYFLSTRDGKPYVIIWGVDLEQKYRGSKLLLAYEQEGLEGRRLAIACNHTLAELTQDEFDDLQWPAGHQPKK